MQALNRRCGEYTASYPGTEMFDFFVVVVVQKESCVLAGCMGRAHVYFVFLFVPYIWILALFMYNN